MLVLPVIRKGSILSDASKLHDDEVEEGIAPEDELAFDDAHPSADFSSVVTHKFPPNKVDDFIPKTIY